MGLPDISTETGTSREERQSVGFEPFGISWARYRRTRVNSMKNAPPRRHIEWVKPFLLLISIMGMAAGALAVVQGAAPGLHLIDWTWWLYGIGGTVIFLLLSRKGMLYGKRGRSVSSQPGEREAAEPEPAIDKEASSLDEIRRRIRHRKQERR